jgi:hypothetical protein
MAGSEDDGVKTWSAEELTSFLTVCARTYLGMTLQEFVDAADAGTIDECEYSALLSFLRMLRSGKEELAPACV